MDCTLCFGLYTNMALLPPMLKPVLQCKDLRRAAGPDRHLTKQGIFADRLVVTYDI
jgi:hypothetical protein